MYKESTLKLYTGSQRLQASTARLARVQGHRSGGGVTSEESFLDVGDTFAYLVGTRNSKGCYSLGLFQINSYSTPADDEALSFGANLSGTLMQVVDDGSASSREVMERRE